MKPVSSSNARFSPARLNAQICVYRGSPASSASAVSTTPTGTADRTPGRPRSSTGLPRPRLPVRRRQEFGPDQEIRPPEQRRPRPASGQRPLIDDPGPAPDGIRRRPGPVFRPADVHDVKPVRAEPLKHGPLVHLPAPDQILEPDVELPRRPQLPRALSRSSCVSRRQARKLPTSLAATRTRPSMIFILIPNDLRSQLPDSSPPTPILAPASSSVPPMGDPDADTATMPSGKELWVLSL